MANNDNPSSTRIIFEGEGITREGLGLRRACVV